MHFPTFDQAWFLQSLGWAIVNSLWQGFILWLTYILVITADKRMPALVRYHLSNILLLTSFAWFIITLIQNYRALTNTSSFPLTHFQIKLSNVPELVNAILPLLSLIYIVSLFRFGLRFVKKLSTAHFLQTNGVSKAPIDFRLFVQKTAYHLGIKKTVTVWMSEIVSVPTVAGFFKPVILLPAAIINNLSIQQTEAILLHELAHIRRNDYLVNVLQSIIQLVLFFNPFAILLGKISKSERENCCDDWVLRFEYNRHEYANALLILEEKRMFCKTAGLGLSATNGKKQLLIRIKRLFSNEARPDAATLDNLKLVGLSFILFISMATFLPQFGGNSKNPEPLVYKKGSILTPYSLTTQANLKEKHAQNAILNTPMIPDRKHSRIVVKRNTKQKRSTLRQEISVDYVNAFINEELVSPQISPVPVTVAEQGALGSKIIVTVEEEQSGTKQTNTYYFELNKSEGIISVKPLVILNKINIKNKSVISKKDTGSLKLFNKSTVKKRVTS